MRIKKIKVTNFRQFKEKSLEFDGNLVLIEGPNAKGKSSIIEAIYMLSNGESPWTNENSNIIHLQAESGNPIPDYEQLFKGTCRIEAEVETTDEVSTITLVLENRSGTVSRQYLIDSQPTTRNKFTQKLYSCLFSPDLIDLLMFEPRQRRDFLDFQISQIDPAYNAISQNYAKILRNRNSLLKVLAGKKHNFRINNTTGITESDKSQLTYWTEQLIDLGSDIMNARLEFVKKINNYKSENYQARIKYQPKVILTGRECDLTLDKIKTNFQQQLEGLAEKELLVGQSLIGPHRDDWYLSEKDRNINIFGSRGEKRMAIADVIFKVNLYMRDNLNDLPVVLLDDITSELDSGNITKLFKEKIDTGQQTIVTTTSIKEIPEEVCAQAQIIRL